MRISHSAFACAICLFFQQAMASDMPLDWGGLKKATTLENGCLNISGEYENSGTRSKDNPYESYGMPDLSELLPFYARVPKPVSKFVIKQNSSVMETTSIGKDGGFVTRTYTRGKGNQNEENYFDCEDGVIVLKGHIEFAGEQGQGVSDSTIRMMVAEDGALIIHQIVHNRLTSLLIFRHEKTDEYWYRYSSIAQ